MSSNDEACEAVDGEVHHETKEKEEHDVGNSRQFNTLVKQECKDMFNEKCHEILLDNSTGGALVMMCVEVEPVPVDGVCSMT